MHDKIVAPHLAGETGRVKWKKNEGDEIALDEVVLELDVGFMIVPVKSPCSGRLGKRALEESAETHGGVPVASIVEDIVPQKTSWVCITCTFKCRACAFEVPLDELDMDGAVVCAHCGLEQAFEQKLWHGAFDFAHSVADRVADKTHVVLDTENKFRVNADGGEPACSTCKKSYEISIAPSLTTAICKTCNTTTEFVVPASAAHMTKDALRGVIADAHRKDATVKVEQSASAIAIQCPSCSAALDASADSKFVTCKFCKTTSRIPNAIWFKLKGANAKPAPMWLAFAGESRARHDIERDKRNDEQEALTARIREGHREASAAHEKERVKAADARAAKAVENEEAEEARYKAERVERVAKRDAESKRNGVLVVVALLVVAVLATIAFVELVH